MEVVGGDGAERDLRRMGKAAPLDKGGRGGEDGGSPEFLTKGQFQRGAEGVTIYASAKGGRGEWGRRMAWRGGLHLRLKKGNQGCRQSTPHTQQ